jgi:hypothetical protein
MDLPLSPTNEHDNLKWTTSKESAIISTSEADSQQKGKILTPVEFQGFPIHGKNSPAISNQLVDTH